MTDLHIKYRPKTLKGIIGQAEVVRALQRLSKMPHAVLFAGPSGVGKTTLARIIAASLQAEVVEVDAATNSGIDAARALVEPLQYQPIIEGKGNKVVILDECQGLSKQAWQSLLKVVEEPPDHVYFCFCTTELEKVPATIRTRCHLFQLRSVAPREIEGLLRAIEKREKRRVPDGALEYIARYCYGSVRQALVYWTLAADAKRLDDIKLLVAAGADDADAITLYRLLISGRANFVQCVKILKKMEAKAAVSYEGLRIGLLNYTTAVIMGNKTPVEQHLAILETFSQPYQKSTEKPDFILSLALLFRGGQ